MDVEFSNAFAELPTPCPLLDLDVLERNLERMAARARRLGVALRPHAKTHKCLEIARHQRELGAIGLTVATLEEARGFIDGGFDDLTWAFPVILGRVGEARALAERATLRLVVDSHEAIDVLENAGFPFHVWLKVDAGYHRVGVDPGSEHALALAGRLAGSRSLVFDGILSHSGQGYHAIGCTALARVAEAERQVMASFAERLRTAGFAVRGVSVGSTPAMSAAESLEGMSEARPGNYVFHDFTQTVLGACGVADCAVTVLASVVSCQPGASHAVLDAGALALSKDTGPSGHEPASMGRLYANYAAGKLSPGVWLTALSQEHGIVNAPLPVGARVRILPNHSCLVVPNFAAYTVVRGENVVGRWPILGGSDRG